MIKDFQVVFFSVFLALVSSLPHNILNSGEHSNDLKHISKRNTQFVFPENTNDSSFAERVMLPTTTRPLPLLFQYPTEETPRAILPIWEGGKERPEGPEDKPSSDAHEELRLSGRRNFRPTLSKDGTPSCAKHQNSAATSAYCDETDDYPDDYIRTQRFGVLYGDERIISPRLPSNLTMEESVCVAQEVYIYPKIARNKENDWMFIVNNAEYVQGVRIAKCLNEGKECRLGIAASTGYQTVCRQKYIYRKLIALEGNGKSAADSFWLPSCCVCYVKSDFLLGRAKDKNKNDAEAANEETTPNV